MTDERLLFAGLNEPSWTWYALSHPLLSRLGYSLLSKLQSIAIAFYFAARGIGQLPTLPTPTPYTSTARVLLSGLGADELLGGYARHRRAFHKTPGGGDWRSVISELQMDIDRLPTRNLGRDDRIISFHGKEARYPFLAGHVVDFCARTPVWMKMDYRFPEGVGDKMLLRLLAKQLGLKDAAGLKKRAIHFGKF